MAVWTGNLSDVGLGHLAGLNPVIEFHLNEPQMGGSGQVYATSPARTEPSSSGAFSVDLVDTTAMIGDAWLEMHVLWNDPGTGTANGHSTADVHIKTPLRTDSVGGPLSGAIGAVANLAMVYISLTEPTFKLPGMLWWKTDPENPNNPANTGLISRFALTTSGGIWKPIKDITGPRGLQGVAGNPLSAAGAQQLVDLYGFITGADPRMPQLETADDFLALVLDSLNRQTWLGVQAEDGGPTTTSMRHLNMRLGVELANDVPGYLALLLDPDGLMTDLAIREEDGQFEDFVVARLLARMQGQISTGAVFSDSPWVPESDIRPMLPDMGRISGWGHSSMDGIASELAIMATGFGASYYNGGKGSEVGQQTAGRLGSIPALLTLTGGAVPASGPVQATAEGHPANALFALRSYTGTLAGIHGTLSYRADPAGYIFTRTTAGSVTVIPAGTPFIPDGQSYRDSVMLLWLGKNNLAGSPGNDSLAIDITDKSYNWLIPLARRALVLGQFCNTGWSAGDAKRAQVASVNRAGLARYGQAFVDVGGYLTGSQVWIDTGITPTTADLAEQAIGNMPPSLANDPAHMNAAAYKAVRKLIAARITALRWY